MNQSLQLFTPHNSHGTAKDSEFVTMRVGGQLFGIPVMQVHDVLRGLTLTTVPLAPKEVAGSLNLRGRIVTAINMHECLGLAQSVGQQMEKTKIMSVVVEHKDEYFSLIVDSVGEVITLPASQMEKTPGTLSGRWREATAGIYPMQNELLVILDIQKLLTF